MDYHKALAYLNEMQEMHGKLTLENIQKIIDNLPFEINGITFIQVAGTNGKGSTAHFLTSILQAAGKKTGLFTSPHLQDIRERITIDKTWISQEDFALCLSRIKEISEELLRKKSIANMPTFFEHLFLLSLYYFSRERVDYAVLEVGLGGRLDATSTIKPALSVITTISHDHNKILGKRIEQIAVEKAGIIKNNVPVVCGCSVHSPAHQVIKKIAGEKNAPFFNVLDAQNKLETYKNNGFYRCTYTTQTQRYDFDVYLNGLHQARNAAISVKAIEILNKQGNDAIISRESISEGVVKNFVPGRIEIIPNTPPIILDGSHNVESIRALRDFLQQEKKKNLTLVFGVLRDKRYRAMISLLLPYAKNVILTQPDSWRALPPQRLLKSIEKQNSQANRHLNIIVKKDPGDAFQEAGRLGEDILITGSLYLAGEMRNIIRGGLNG